MVRKGQVTIFVAIGALILILGGLGIYLLMHQRATATSNPDDADQDIRPIAQYIHSCLTQSVDASVPVFLADGMRYDPSARDRSIDYLRFGGDGLGSVPIYIDQNGNSYLPTENELNAEFGLLVKDAFVICADNVASIQNATPYLFSTPALSLVDVTAMVTGGRIVVRATYPLELSNGDEHKQLKQVSYELPYNIMEKYKYASDFVASQKQDMTKLSTRLAINARDHDFTYQAEPQDEDVLVYTLIFHDYTMIRPTPPLTYSFAVEYKPNTIPATT
jgi:hypothetical protein